MGKKTRLRLVTFAAVALGGLLLALFLGRFFEIQHLHQELVALSEETFADLSEQDELRARLAQANDPLIIEDLAREWFGLVKPGEEKIIFIKED